MFYKLPKKLNFYQNFNKVPQFKYLITLINYFPIKTIFIKNFKKVFIFLIYNFINLFF